MKTTVLLALLMTASGAAHASLADLQNMRTADFLLGTADTGCQPKGLKSDAKGEFAYVAEMCGKKINNQRVATVSIFNLKTMQLEKTVVTPPGAVPGKPGILGNTEVNFTLDQDYVLAARAEGSGTTVYPGQGMLTVIDTRQQAIKEFIPVKGTGTKIIEMRPLVASEGNKQIVYAANYFSDDISVIDTTDIGRDSIRNNDSRYVTKIKFHTMFPAKNGHVAPRGVAFTPDGRYAIVDATETGTIFIVDSVRHKQIAELGPVPADLGSVPLRQQQNGKTLNVRHVVMTKDGKLAYLSHMRGDKVSRISVTKLITEALALNARGQSVIPSSFWHDLLVPFGNGQTLLNVQHYPKDQPPLVIAKGGTIAAGGTIDVAGKDWDLARPNTIVLDPMNERYLYVSCRTDTNPDYNFFSVKTRGKIDVIDTKTGQEIFTFVGGAQPTALESTPDNRLLISGGFKDDKLYFFDMKKLLDIYEH